MAFTLTGRIPSPAYTRCFSSSRAKFPEGDEKALGAILPVWCDGNLSSEKRVLEQYPLYPCVLTFAERVWRGGATKRKDYMAQLPPKGTAGWAEFRSLNVVLSPTVTGFSGAFPLRT